MKTQDDADLRLLSLANEKGKFALSLSDTGIPDIELQAAFERGIDEEWFTLVDVSVLGAAGSGPALMRVFRLTLKGAGRLGFLAAQKGRMTRQGGTFQAAVNRHTDAVEASVQVARDASAARADEGDGDAPVR